MKPKQGRDMGDAAEASGSACGRRSQHKSRHGVPCTHSAPDWMPAPKRKWRLLPGDWSHLQLRGDSCPR